MLSEGGLKLFYVQKKDFDNYTDGLKIHLVTEYIFF